MPNILAGIFRLLIQPHGSAQAGNLLRAFYPNKIFGGEETFATSTRCIKVRVLMFCSYTNFLVATACLLLSVILQLNCKVHLCLLFFWETRVFKFVLTMHPSQRTGLFPVMDQAVAFQQRVAEIHSFLAGQYSMALTQMQRQANEALQVRW